MDRRARIARVIGVFLDNRCYGPGIAAEARFARIGRNGQNHCQPEGWRRSTTTTLNLGAALTATGQRVSLIDLDPQAALSYGFDVRTDTLSRMVCSALIETEQPPAVSVLLPVRERLDLLPANIDLAAAERLS